METLLVYALTITIFAIIVLFSSLKVNKKKKAINDLLDRKTSMLNDLEFTSSNIGSAMLASQLYAASVEVEWVKRYVEKTEKSAGFILIRCLTPVSINFEKINTRLSAIFDRLDVLYEKHGIEKSYKKLKKTYNIP